MIRGWCSQRPPLKTAAKRLMFLGDVVLPKLESRRIKWHAPDVAGAKSFGYKVCWCNRSQGHIEHLRFSADLTISELDQIPNCL
jgi:hypothetical protein